MEEIRIVPPPLPPKKTRRIAPSTTSSSSTTTTTVLTSLPSSLTTTTTTSTSGDVFNYQVEDSTESHVVKIRINPKCDDITTPCIRININNNNNNSIMDAGSLFYNNFGTVMSSGQISPSDTLDSGTCSDLDGTPPPLPKKKSSGITITLIQHKRANSSSGNDSDDNDSNISCDSLSSKSAKGILPPTLLQDIRNIKLNNTNNNDDDNDKTVIKSFQTRPERDEDDDVEIEQKSANFHYETDMFYKFHLNENINNEQIDGKQKNIIDDDETFAGYKDLLNGGGAITTIRSAKGTVRGVKNRVRAGIATFLQINSTIKNYKEKDAGKVVVYTTTMGILRETYQACMKVKQILRTLMVKFEERDVFMSNEYQTEIKERMRCNYILVPQVFVDGQHIGDVETIERLNESGELRRILKPFKSADVCSTCKICGGYRLLPCPVCNGSKKSVHRNHFTTEFVALKCMNCDEVGLVRCNAC